MSIEFIQKETRTRYYVVLVYPDGSQVQNGYSYFRDNAEKYGSDDVLLSRTGWHNYRAVSYFIREVS